jgi:hypothetical protein
VFIFIDKKKAEEAESNLQTDRQTNKQRDRQTKQNKTNKQTRQ